MSKAAFSQKDIQKIGEVKGDWFPWIRMPSLSKEVLGGRRALIFFRYVSWFLTSLFYLLGSEESLFIFKIAVILALLSTSYVAVRLYTKSRSAPANIVGLIIIDSLFIACLVMPTGGVTSPFIWYALNPVFMAFSMLPVLYCWVMFGIMIAAAAISALYYGDIAKIYLVLMQNSWFSLVFLLLTTAALLFARLNKQLSEAYEKLSEAHQSTERLLDYVSDLYHALESFSVGEDPHQSARLLATYARRLTGSLAGVCFLAQDQYNYLWETADPDGVLNHFRRRNIEAVWRQVKEGQAQVYRLPLEHSVLEGKEIICVPLQSESTCFGLLGYVVYSGYKNIENKARAVSYLAELVAIVLERYKAEDLGSRLMVAEEQNRIANEIHDGVSQQLFSVVYALHSISKKRAFIQDREVQQQLSLIKKTANQAAKDLRTSIYKISPSKRGEKVFTAGVSIYLEDLAMLNNMSVEFYPEGSEESLSPALRKALYRIIREATSNALRHGRCKSVQVRLNMTPSQVMLQITDDGKGFAVDEQKQRGLGLANMRSLVETFNGRFSIESEPGCGTKVTCIAPDTEIDGDKYFPGGAEIESRCS